MILELNRCLPALAQQINATTHLFVGLDYDGTLTPIVNNPAEASLSPAVREVLAKLAQLSNTTVAIVTGRALADVRERVNLGSLAYAGNHGLEIHVGDNTFLEPTAALLAAFLSQIVLELQMRLAPYPGVFVEEKGLSLSVHFRNVDPTMHNDVLCEVHRVMASRESPFRLSSGKMVWEITPRVGWHKGRALEWVRTVRQAESALTIYLGDDQTDEDAFRFVPDIVSVKVGPPQDTCAKFYLPDSHQVHAFLEWLLQTRTGLANH